MQAKEILRITFTDNRENGQTAQKKFETFATITPEMPAFNDSLFAVDENDDAIVVTDEKSNKVVVATVFPASKTDKYVTSLTVPDLDKDGAEQIDAATGEIKTKQKLVFCVEADFVEWLQKTEYWKVAKSGGRTKFSGEALINAGVPKEVVDQLNTVRDTINKITEEKYGKLMFYIRSKESAAKAAEKAKSSTGAKFDATAVKA
jgi:hypothetical protein